MKALSPAPGNRIAIASAEPMRLGRELETQRTPIAPLPGRLAYTAGVRNWGYRLRSGLLAIEAADRGLIAGAKRQRLAA